MPGATPSFNSDVVSNVNDIEATATHLPLSRDGGKVPTILCKFDLLCSALALLFSYPKDSEKALFLCQLQFFSLRPFVRLRLRSL